MTRLIVFCLALVTGALTLTCFYGTTIKYPKGSPSGSLTNVQCPNSYYCMKIAAYGSSYDSFSYGCADYRCQRNGCTNKGSGYKECCCSKNLCNSGFGFSRTAISSAVLTVLSAVMMF